LFKVSFHVSNYEALRTGKNFIKQRTSNYFWQRSRNLGK